MRPLRIAMIGQKGIPARYGGVETHVENVASRLVERGHDVWVFCRSRFREDAAKVDDGYTVEGGVSRYRGVRLVYRSSLNTKHLDAASHTFLCALEAGMKHDFDIVHFHGIGPSAFAPVTRVFGRTVVSTFHALDWRQVKWGARAKKLLRDGEARGARRSHGVIAVSRIMERYVRETYGVDATYIPNGATIAMPRSVGTIGRWGLSGEDYILTVGRIIPDRELHTLIEAFQRMNSGLKLVIVGSETPPTEYGEELARLAGDRVIFTGDLFGDDLEDLYANCLLYVLASRVEGLPITPCEAMAHARPVLLSDIPENQEVGGDAVALFPCGDAAALTEAMESLLGNEIQRKRLAQAGYERAKSIYNWDLITEQIESFYYRVLGERSSD